MLTFFGAQQRYCDGISRRNFLRIGAFGAGLTLADMLRSRVQGSSIDPSRKATSGNKAAIMIYLPGGPSHMDMWDLKPEAPAEFRGEFKPIATNVPGVQISEHFPMQARMWDKMSVIRSVKSSDEHSDSLVTTGYTENANRIQQHPSFGSVVSRTRQHSGNDIPPFVSLRGMSVGTEPGYLGIAHRPFTPDGPGLRNLQMASGVTMDRMDDRKALLSSLDNIRRDVDASGTMNGMDSFTTRAFDMVASGAVRKALDLTKEDPRCRDRYKGVEQFLTARRLVESGVGCVTLSFGGWDTHSANFKTLKTQLPKLDVALASLVQDLHDRGMDQDVTVLCWGEFGRTPKINTSDAGRDHWGPVMSCFLAGGPFKMGQAIGTTSERGEYAKDRPYTPANILSTVYTGMGIDPAQTFNNGAGRPMYVLDERDPVVELL